MTAGRGRAPSPTLSGWQARIVWLVAASSIVAILLAQSFNPDALIVVLIITEVVLSFALVGAVLVTRVPSNSLSWLLFICGPGLAWATMGIAYATRSGLECGGCLPASAPVAVVSNVAFVPLLGVIGVFIPLLFPDGRLPSPRWRPVAWLGAAASLLFAAVTAFTPGTITDSIAIENPIGVEALRDISGPTFIVALGSLAIAMALAFASVVWRSRHSDDPVLRQQLRWFGYAGLIMVVFVVIGLLAPWDSGWVLMFAGFGALPLATGVAVLRYRLYDLDRLISRTIAYGLVTGALLVVYLAVNLTLTSLLSSITTTDSLAVAASTLIVAALFAPIRRRVKRIVDRRFDRSRYDAEGTTTAFSERLRDEVDLAAVAGDLDRTVRAALSPAHIGVWLRETE